jgi:hypothetical protein
MTDQPSSTATKKSKKKGRGVVNFIRDLVKQPKSANDSASQSGSVSSASTTRYHVPGNDAGSAEPTASSKYIVSYLSVIGEDWASPDPRAPVQSAMARPPIVPYLPVSAVSQSELRYA